MPKESLLGAFWEGLGGIMGGCFDTFCDIVGTSFLKIYFCVWLGRGRGRAEGAGEDHWN